VKLTNKWTNRRSSWQDTVPGARWTYIILALKVAFNSALISASCFTALTETTFAPKLEVALRVYCLAVRVAMLATAWLLVMDVALSTAYVQFLRHATDSETSHNTLTARHVWTYSDTTDGSQKPLNRYILFHQNQLT